MPWLTGAAPPSRLMQGGGPQFGGAPLGASTYVPSRTNRRHSYGGIIPFTLFVLLFVGVLVGFIALVSQSGGKKHPAAPVNPLNPGTTLTNPYIVLESTFTNVCDYLSPTEAQKALGLSSPPAAKINRRDLTSVENDSSGGCYYIVDSPASATGKIDVGFSIAPASAHDQINTALGPKGAFPADSVATRTPVPGLGQDAVLVSALSDVYLGVGGPVSQIRIVEVQSRTLVIWKGPFVVEVSADTAGSTSNVDLEKTLALGILAHIPPTPTGHDFRVETGPSLPVPVDASEAQESLRVQESEKGPARPCCLSVVPHQSPLGLEFTLAVSNSPAGRASALAICNAVSDFEYVDFRKTTWEIKVSYSENGVTGPLAVREGKTDTCKPAP